MDTKISIVIVSWNVKKLLRECLASVFASKGDFELEVFVVDNNSKDGSASMVKMEFIQAKLIANERNLGYAKGNNQAIRQATGDFILLLNPDTVIEPDTLAQAVKFMTDYPDCGIMGPRMVYADGQAQPSVRRFPTVSAILLMLVKAPKIFKKLKAIDNYLAVDFDYAKTQTIDQVMGAFMMIRREVIEKIGLLDEGFFVWFEEVDLCRRAWQRGFRVYYNADMTIIHHGGKSFAQQSLAVNQWRFFASAWRHFIKTMSKK